MERSSDDMRLPRAVMATASKIAKGVLGSSRDTLSVIREVARSWIRDAYLAGYRDGAEDALFAHGWDGCADLSPALRRQAELRIRASEKAVR